MLPPQDDVDQWCVHSEELVVALAVRGGGAAAEEIIRELIAMHAPEVLDRVEFDSHDVIFSAYTDDEGTARRVADIVSRAAELSS